MHPSSNIWLDIYKMWRWSYHVHGKVLMPEHLIPLDLISIGSGYRRILTSSSWISSIHSLCAAFSGGEWQNNGSKFFRSFFAINSLFRFSNIISDLSDRYFSGVSVFLKRASSFFISVPKYFRYNCATWNQSTITEALLLTTSLAALT